MSGFQNLQYRRGTEAAWESVNPILLDGEPGWATDVQNMKIGDGVTAWMDLPYLMGGAATDHGTLSGLADDDHPQYTDDTEVIAIANSIAAAEATAQIGTHNSDLSAHAYFLTEDEADLLYDALGAADAALAAAQTFASDADTVVLGDAYDYTDSSISTHAGDADAHGDFLTEAEADALYDALGAAATALSDANDYTDAAIPAAISGHEGAGDPHPGYLTAAEGNAAYAGISEPIAAAHIVDNTAPHSHDDLGGVSADDHHAQVHGNADHTSAFATAAALANHLATENADHGLEHSDLNSVGANDHHNQSHGNGDHTTAFTDDTTVNAHTADTLDAHDASAISVDSTTLTGVGDDVQEVLEELDNLLDSHTHAATPPTYANAFKFS